MRAAAPQRMPDLGLASMALLLALSGVVFSGSARVFSEVESGVAIGVARSLVYLALGVGAMSITMALDYRRLTSRGFAWLLFVVTSIVLVAMLFVPSVANTQRFVSIGGLSVQPSEFAKPVLVLVIAAAITKAGDEIREIAGLARPLVLTALIAGLVLVGRDLGTPVLMFATTLAMIVAAGARWRHMGVIVGGGGLAFALAAASENYRRQRVLDYVHGLNVGSDSVASMPDGLYQLKQSYLALGSGGLVGRGLGSSTQKQHFLPAPDNDFVFAIVGEELGLIATLVLLVVFLVLAWRGHVIAMRAPDETGRLVALGATWSLCGQALCHMAVVTGLLPTKGLPLPFISSGGSSLIASFVLVGLVLNVSLRSHRAGIAVAHA